MAVPATAGHGIADRALLAFERHGGRAVIALLVAVAMLGLAIARVPLGTRPTFLGKSYAELSLAPFAPDPSNPVAHRILTPLLSYLVGLRGRGLLVTNLVFATVLLALVYGWMRRRGHPPSAALLPTALAALTMVTLTTIHYGGYCDSLTYLLIFAAWRVRERPALLAGTFWLAMLNHESAIFLAPWLLVAAAAEAPSRRRGLAAAAAIVGAIVAFLLVRQVLSVLHPGVEYSAGFYLEPLRSDPLHWYRQSETHLALGVFSAFGLFWAFAIAAAAHQLATRRFADAVVTLLPIGCAYAQLFAAYDTTRMMTLAFMSPLLGLEYLLRTDALGARRWAPAVCVAAFFVPQVNVAGGTVDPMR